MYYGKVNIWDLKEASFLERLFLLCPLFGGSTIRGSIVLTCDFILFQFAVRCKCRNNNVIKQKDVIDLLASVVTDDGTYHHVVNLDTPELVIFVVIIKVRDIRSP